MGQFFDLLGVFMSINVARNNAPMPCPGIALLSLRLVRVSFVVLVVVLLGACGSSSDSGASGSNWDQMKWDQGKWG